MRNSKVKPNIILINCDDLGYGDLGCYGSEVNSTPVLDKMAADGIRFTDFYMGSPVCSPSRGAMMTGCYPSRIGFDTFENDAWVLFPGMGCGLNPSEITVASLLKKQGYATKLVGKWHCGDQPGFLPTDHGFDEYFGLPYSNDMGRQIRSDGTVPRKTPLPLMKDDTVLEQQPDQAALTERYTFECVDFMRRKQDNPFFLYLAHMHVHLPIYTPEKFLKQSRNGRYGAGVESVDWSTGAILHELKRLGLEDDTLVIFTSDNGSRCRGEGGSNGRMRDTKGTTYEGGMRVPCIMRWPGKVRAGRVCNGIAMSLDFLPTFTTLAGGTVPDDRIIDGNDISGVLLYGSEPERQEVYYYGPKNALEALRSGRWKLHVQKRQNKVFELYDLVADPGEQNNCVDTHPEVVVELQRKLQACREDLGDTLTGTEGKGRRPIGRVDNPETLTTFDPDYPYFMAEYDLSDVG